VIVANLAETQELWGALETDEDRQASDKVVSIAAVDVQLL
jgi:hypothetical protein